MEIAAETIRVSTLTMRDRYCEKRGADDGGLMPLRRGCHQRRVRPAMAIIASFTLISLCLKGAFAQPGSKDYIDPVFTGGGIRPPNDTTIFMSVYLDRLIDVNEVNYLYSASFYFLLSWVDPRAFKDIADATAAIEADPTKTCERLCNRQKSPAPGAPCCDTLWLPTILIRNINEFPQGRTQPSYITATPEGIVTWRVEIRADLYTTLDLVAFPYDTQSLDLIMQILNWSDESKIYVTPSATGTKLFLSGSGDDLSRFSVKGLRIYAHDPEPWTAQFNDPQLKNLQTYSDPADPSPVAPLPAGALLRNGSISRAPAVPAFGANYTVTEVTVAIIISRNSLFDSLNIILPVFVCTSISLLTFFVEPEKLDTRLQIIITLFLSLVALQFVVQSDLPSSSYVLPTFQLTIVSYLVLLLACFEALIVYNVASWDRVLNWFQGMHRAKHARASLVAAQQRREEEKALAEEGRAATAAAVSETEEKAAPGAFAAASPRGGAAGALEGGEGGKKEAAAAAQPPQARPSSPSAPLGRSLSPSRPSSFAPARATPWWWRRSRAETGRFPTSSAAPPRGGRRAAAVSELDDFDDFALGEASENGGGASSAPPAAAAASGINNNRATTTASPLLRDSSLARSRRRRQAIARQLDAEARASWYAYVAWRIDMTCAFGLGVVYILVAILIFAIGVARAPSECELSGQDKALCERTKAAILKHGRDSGYGGVHHPHNG